MPQSTLERIVREMCLREPQEDSLRKFASVIEAINLGKMDQARIRRLLETGVLRFPDEYARLTFALATGVGKTRLMGAIAALLFLEGKSQHFVFLAPSSEILRKMKAEAVTTHPKYLFKGLSGFPNPEVVHADNFTTYHPEQMQLFERPVLFILTPGQIRPRSGSEVERRLRRESEEFGPSFVDFLASLPGLVVFLDEGHRYGLDAREERAWARAISDLKPKLVIGMTATPTNPSTVLYRYDLGEALRDGKYIKNVVAIYEQRPPIVSDEAWDRHTLLEAIKRLEVKKGAIAAYRRNYPDTSQMKPALLVVCRDAQHHAPQVESFLESDDCFAGKYKGKVLRVDSTLPEDEWLPELLQVETPENPKEIVVNVGMLKEGWDVNNVYVIAPLRAMLSETLTTQTIGRGLRLPFGRRVGESEIDTLDVLAFGRETVQEVIQQARQVGVPVREGGNGGNMTFHTVAPSRPIVIRVPSIAPKFVSPPSLAGWSAQRRVPIDIGERAMVVQVEAGTGEVTILDEAIRIDVPNPAKALGQILCRKIWEITGQEDQAERIFREYLQGAGCIDIHEQRTAVQRYGDQIYRDVFDQVEKLVTQAAAKFEREEQAFEDFVFGEVTHSIPATDGVIDQSSANLPRDKSKAISGWQRSLYPNNKFDTANELVVAQILDLTPGITWVRNPVRHFGIDTQIGRHYPDFLVIRNDDYVLLEVKNREELNNTESDAYKKGKATAEWCELASSAGASKWQCWLIPDDRVPSCATIDDLPANRFLFPSS